MDLRDEVTDVVSKYYHDDLSRESSVDRILAIFAEEREKAEAREAKLVEKLESMASGWDGREDDERWPGMWGAAADELRAVEQERDDLAIANRRLREVADALARYIKGDDNFASDEAACAYATLALPAAGPVPVDDELRWLLENAGTWWKDEWQSRRDAVLASGGKA